MKVSYFKETQSFVEKICIIYSRKRVNGRNNVTVERMTGLGIQILEQTQ